MSATVIVPAIDMIGGKCVRLTKGDYGKVREYGADPADQAKRFMDCGITRLHLVDLDGAKSSRPENLRSLERIATAALDYSGCELEWGGGIRSTEALHSIFDAGAGAAIIGSVAVRQPALMEEWLGLFGGSRIVLGADALEGKIAVSGWMESSDATVASLTSHFAGFGLQRMICTDIGRDGMLSGIDCKFYRGLQDAFPGIEVTVSGGVSSMDDISAAAESELKSVIVGKAYYEGKISLEDIASWMKDGR